MPETSNKPLLGDIEFDIWNGVMQRVGNSIDTWTRLGDSGTNYQVTHKVAQRTSVRLVKFYAATEDDELNSIQQDMQTIQDLQGTTIEVRDSFGFVWPEVIVHSIQQRLRRINGMESDYVLTVECQLELQPTEEI